MKKLILISLLLTGMVHSLMAATVTTSKAVYATNEQVHVHFANMTAQNQDWIAIYPEGSSNDWDNVIGWKWTDDKAEGDLVFGNGNNLPLGKYEVRAFYNNSFHTEATTKFEVKNAVAEAKVTTDKAVYTANEQVHVHFANMTAQNQDWIGIYPEGSSNDWGNVVDWSWTNDTQNGNLTFNNLPTGKYEARAFYNNSFHTEATTQFEIKNAAAAATVTTDKDVYTTDEQIHVHFANMTAQNDDWIGIYPEGTNNDWGNVVAWRWTNDTTNGDLNFNALPEGSYEVRAFYNNSFHTEATKKFKVEGDAGPDYIFYFGAEHGGLDKWVKYAGDKPAQIIVPGAQGTAHSIRTPKWGGYYFDFGTPAKKLKFLNLDTRIGTASHVGNFGVLVKTSKGNRRIIFSSYMNHPGNDFSGLPPEKWQKPFLSSNGYQHNHPGPTDYYLATRNGDFVHYKINIEEKLQVLEPGIKLLSIMLFTTAGGDFDNIALSAN